MNSLSIKKKRRSQQDKLEKECAFLSQAVVKKRAGNRCEVTGEMCALSDHHVFHKGNYPILRYNPDNGVALGIKGHNKFHAEGENALKAFLIKKRGQSWYDRLVKIKQIQNFQFSVEILQDIKYKLEAELES